MTPLSMDELITVTNSPMPTTEQQLKDFVCWLHDDPRPCVELRILTNKWIVDFCGVKIWKQQYGGTFTDLQKFYDAGMEWSGYRLSNEGDADVAPHVLGCYLGINPPDPEKTVKAIIKGEERDLRVIVSNSVGPLGKRGHHRAVPHVLIKRRTAILIDIDSLHPIDDCATDEEKARAAKVRNEVINYLSDHGIAHFAVVDSGNGYHIYVPVDLPNDDIATNLVQRFLYVLSKTFSGDNGKIDDQVYDASRIGRLPSTLAAKGEGTDPLRPWRKARILQLPDSTRRYTAEELEVVAECAKEKVPLQPRRTGRTADTAQSVASLEHFFDEKDIGDTGPDHKADGIYYYVSCPWAESHSTASNGTDVAVRVNSNGYAFICQHSHKDDYGWALYREYYDPDRTFRFVEPMSNEEMDRVGKEKWGGLEHLTVLDDVEVAEAGGGDEPNEQQTLGVTEADIAATVEKLHWTMGTNPKGEEVQKGKSARQLRLDVTNYLYEALRSEGRGLLLDQHGRFWYKNPLTGHMARMDGKEFEQRLFYWGLPRSENRGAILGDLLSLIYGGQRAPVMIYPTFHYDVDTFTLYVNISNEKLCVITPEGWSIKPIGWRGVWMYSQTNGLPADCLPHIKRWEGCGLALTDSRLCTLTRVLYECEGAVGQEDYEQLYLTKLISGCLPEMSKRKNIAAAISNRHASGKTFLFSYPGWLIEGPTFQPINVSQKKDSDQLETVLTQKSIMLADNIDRGSTMSQALLCMAATSGKIAKRKHYADFDLAEASITADLYMTGLQLPSSFKGDVYSRLLIFKLIAQPEDGLSETDRERRFLRYRNEMLGELLSRLQAVVRDEALQARESKIYKTQFRIKDFGLFLLRQNDIYGRATWASRVLDAITDEQQNASVETSAIEPVLDLMVGRYGSRYHGEKVQPHRATAGNGQNP